MASRGQREGDDRLLANLPKDSWEDVTSMASPVPLLLPLLPSVLHTWHSAVPCWPQLEAALGLGVGQSQLPETCRP